MHGQALISFHLENNARRDACFNGRGQALISFGHLSYPCHGQALLSVDECAWTGTHLFLSHLSQWTGTPPFRYLPMDRHSFFIAPL